MNNEMKFRYYVYLVNIYCGTLKFREIHKKWADFINFLGPEEHEKITNLFDKFDKKYKIGAR